MKLLLATLRSLFGSVPVPNCFVPLLAQTTFQLDETFFGTMVTFQHRLINWLRIWKDKSLIHRVRDWRVTRRLRRDLIGIIAIERVADLSVDAKKKVCLGLSPRLPRDLKMFKSILCGTAGNELSELKLFIDNNLTRYSLGDVLSKMNLVDGFDCLEHFADEAENLSFEKEQVRLISDIDDTIICNLLDYKYPRGTLYPGALPFVSSVSPQGAVFLTARPKSLRLMTRRSLNTHGIDTSSSTVLFGSLSKILSKSAMASKKLESYTLYRRLYPEFSWVFLGDSGQGDIELAQNIMKYDKKPPKLVLIHDIVLRNLSYKISLEQRKDLQNQGIIVFDNYITAAKLANSHGIISESEKSLIIQSVLDSFVTPSPVRPQFLGFFNRKSNGSESLNNDNIVNFETRRQALISSEIQIALDQDEILKHKN
jgi:hypothetical protein